MSKLPLQSRLQPIANHLDAPILPPTRIPGRFVMPLLGLWVAFSCSRFFGTPKIEGLPQLTFERIIFTVLVFIAFLSITLRKRPLSPVRWTELALWGVTIYVAISGLVQGGFTSGYPGAGITILLNLLLLPAVVYSIILRTAWTTRDLNLCMIVLTVFGAYLGITAILEKTPLSWVVIPPDVVDPSFEQHWGRSRGPFLQAEFNGAVMVQLLPVTLYLAVSCGRFLRIFAILTSSLLCLGSYLTETRAVLLSLMLILITGAVFRRPQRRIYAVLFLLLLSVGLMKYLYGGTVIPRLDDMGPIHDRLKLLAVTFDMILKHPLAGIGYGNFDLLQEKFFDPRTKIVATFTEGAFWSGGTHNTLLTLFAESGFLVGGLFLFLVLRTPFIGLSRLRSTALARSDSDNRVVLCGTLVCMAFIFNAIFVELRYVLTPSALFWIFAGIIEKYHHSPP